LKCQTEGHVYMVNSNQTGTQHVQVYIFFPKEA
jgi:hypothetical protein